jgi:tetratricopeptide (TPR) repeat protein
MWSLRIPSLQLSPEERARLLADTEGGTPARMRREFCELVRALSRLITVVLALEDFHWADPSSLALLQELVACTDGARVMIVVTSRSGLSLDAAPHVTRMELGGLSASDVETYLDQRFAPNRFSHRFRTELYDRCRGNPLVLGSLLELATRRAVIKRDGIEWTDATDFELEDDTPEVLHAVVDARLRAVPGEARAMLEYASVAGDRFSPLLVAHVAGTSVAQVSSTLAPLQRSQLITVDTEGTYQFTHTRYRAIVYDSISAARRKQIHRDIGAALVILPAEEIRGNAAQIAQHFDAAGEVDRAAKAYVEAAAAAVQRLAYPETEAHVKRALELLDQAGDLSPASLWLRVQCAEWRTEYGRFRDVIRDTREIIVHAERLDDPALESAARRALCMALFYSSQIPDLVVAAKEAIECAVRSGDEIERAKLMVPLGVVQMSQGSIGAARDIFSQNVRVGRRSGDRRVTSPALIALGTLDYFQSNYAAAERQLDEAHAQLQTVRDGFLTANAQFFLALSLGNLGRFDAAFTLLDTAAAFAERNGDAYWSARIPIVRGWLFTELGAYAEARHHNTIAVRLSRTDPAPEPLANGLINLAIACAHAGEHAASSAALEEAGNLCAREAALRWRYDMRHELATAECALARRDLATVCDAARVVLLRADEYGARKYVVDAHRLLAEALVRLGDVTAAREHVDHALRAAAPGAVPLVEWRVHAAAVRVHTAVADEETAAVSRARLDHVPHGLVTQLADAALQRSLAARVAAMLAAS